MPTYGFILNVEAATHNSLTISVTNSVGTSGATFVVAAELSGTVVASTTVTTGTAGESVNAIITGLSPSTTYTITGKINDITEAASITASTTASSSDPKIATETQWQDLANRVNARPIIGTVVSQPTAVAYVGTANIVNNAVTPAKLDMASLIDILYPVGCYFETSDTTFNPNVSWGGTWIEDSTGKVTVSKDSGTFATVGDTGGEETHTLVEAELPSISGYFEIHGEGSGTEFHKKHGNATGTLKSNQYKSLGSSATTGADSYANPGFAFGSGQAHNNLQPYVVVVRWHRTA